MKANCFKRYFLIGLIALAALLNSCTPESCLEETQSYVNANFYINDGSGMIKAPDTLTIYGVGRSNILLYNKALNVSTITLPLDASAESCDFIFIINSITDTVSFTYNSYPHFISKECGYTFFHTLTSPPVPTNNSIDAIYLEDNNVIISKKENIRIFY